MPWKYVLIMSIGALAIFGKEIGVNYLTQTNSVNYPAQLQIRVEAPKTYFPYQQPSIPVKRSYLTFLVGDSMIAALGKNANQLRLDLIAIYPAHEFVNYNYGFGSTNILTVPDRLEKQTTYLGETFPPINDQTFDLIIFESFAYNPLSQYPLSEGLMIQARTLEVSVKSVIDKHPGSVVAIMVPIAPSEESFAKGVYDLTPEDRKQWVMERVAYINNAVDFAQKNNIPLINVYQKSLTTDGKADLKYINPRDFIHPSKEGIRLISKTIADFIYQNRIFPE